MAGKQEKTVLETILEWSKNRPDWQQDALRRIVLKGRLNKIDIQELVTLIKSGNQENKSNLNFHPLNISHLPENHRLENSVSLVSIQEVKNTNNLATNQILNFEPKGLTIIYGHNGTGKSGYSRILKRACRARHRGKIESNIYAEYSTMNKASATITYQDGNLNSFIEKWEDSDLPLQSLSSVSVFDQDCASIHITEKNEVAFRPFGLDIPDELARSCQLIKEELLAEKSELEKSQESIFLTPSWKKDTQAGKIMSSIQTNTDFKTIETLSNLREDENNRLIQLKEDLSKDLIKAIDEQKRKAENIKELRILISSINEFTSDQEFSKIYSSYQDAKNKRQVANLVAEKLFSTQPLAGVGNETWRLLWDSARRYSTEVAYFKQEFPPSRKGSVCVLCQQELSEIAIERMLKFEEFIQQDAEKQAQKSENLAKDTLDKLTYKKISIKTIRIYIQNISFTNRDLSKEITRFIALARLRRYLFKKSLNNTEQPILPIYSINPETKLQEIELEIRNYIDDLQKALLGDERKKLENELSELSDRKIMNNMLPSIKKEIERQKKIKHIDQCITETTTPAITRLGNDIADKIITPKLRDRFQEEIIKLSAEKVRVEIQRSGGKYGVPQYQVSLFAKPTAKVDNILSEGEKTCVALAAFLTELATATHKSTLIFDDPVSSLDHHWRKKVAERLVDEAENRQIIIFTHDLIFINDLKDIATGKNQSTKFVTITRGITGSGIVSDGLPWIGKSLDDRIDKLKKLCRAAREYYYQNDDEKYQEKTTNIYTKFRTCWERLIEDVIFHGVIQRHRDYINTKNLKKVTAFNADNYEIFQAGFKKCCDIIDSHDPSRGRNAIVPSPIETEKDIQIFEDLIIKLKEQQKNIK